MAPQPMPHELNATPRLGKVQRWMQACILASGPVEAALETRLAKQEIPAAEARTLIRPSATLSPLERLDIYRGMYELRLVEALKVDYPGLQHLLGEEMFEELARLYVGCHPSESYTLNRLGDRLPEFVAQVEGLGRPALVAALARLELAETLVFDEEESPVAEASAIANIAPEQWEQLQMQPIRALRFLRLAYPVHEYLQAMRRGDKGKPVMRPRRTNLIVYRRDYALHHLALSTPAFTLFQALAEGRTLGEAMSFMMDEAPVPEGDVFTWFQDWFRERLFARVTLA